MSRRLARVALLCLLLATASAPTVIAVAPERSVLPNGIQLITRHRPGSQVVAIAVAVRAGARYEAENTKSAARLLEDVLTLGTVKRPTRDELLRTLTAKGGRLDVSAGREVIEVNAVVGLPDLDLGLDVVADVLTASRFDEPTIAAQRQVILQQLDERDDDPEEAATDLLFDSIFASHPLAHRPSGTREGVNETGAGALREYWESRLVGPSTFVAVVSGLEHSAVVERLRPTLSGIPAGPILLRNDAELPLRDGDGLEVGVGTDQSHVLVGAPVPGLGIDRAPLRILRAVLGSSSGRLYSEIRDSRGLAYSTSAWVGQYVDAGLFYAYAATEPANADLVAELLRAELAKVRQEQIGDTELRDAIEGEIGSQIVSEERSKNEAVTLARSAAFGLPPRDEEVAQLRAVSAADVQRVAQRYLDPSRLTVVISRPSFDDQ